VKRELFGNSEDGAADIQNDENTDNGLFNTILHMQDQTDGNLATEIAELRKEAFDMRELREALGTDEGYRKVFQKVFGKDIERLRTMKDMWKTRQQPQLLDFDTLDQTLLSIDPAIATKDQEAWTIEENFAVFRDR
jgi:ubiquitin-like 1-activating enzyme E1 B